MNNIPTNYFIPIDESQSEESSSKYQNSNSSSELESLDSEILKIREITENLTEQTTKHLKNHKKFTDLCLAQTGNLNMKLIDLQIGKEFLTPVQHLKEKTEELADEFKRLSVISATPTEECYCKQEILMMLVDAQGELNSLQDKYEEQCKILKNVEQDCEVEDAKVDKDKSCACTCRVF